MPRLLYLSHPEVAIDPNVPVPDWGLDATGRRRVTDWIAADRFAGVTRVVSSAERKAVETAERIAAARGCTAEIRPGTRENDRSATGFLPEAEFRSVVEAFFSRPHQARRGWERAADAQVRIVAETEDLLAWSGAGDVLVVGHGGVGTLLFCHHAGLEIDIRHDQAGSCGNIWAMERPSGPVLHGWRPAEAQPEPAAWPGHEGQR